MSTFAESYCAHYRVRSDRYVSSMFWRCLHRRAWPLVPFLRLLRSDYFEADRELIRDVGRLSRANGLTEDLADYHTNPLNRGFLRRRLGLRVSVRRVTREVHLLLPGRAPTTFYDSAKPFADETAASPPTPERPPHSASN